MKNPLWMPEGSVRAVIVLGVLGAGIAFVAAGLAVPEWMSSVIGLAVGYYFGARGGRDAQGGP